MLKCSSLKLLAVAFLSASLITGCATGSRASYYSTSDTREAKTARLGTIVSVHEVALHNDPNGLVTVIAGGLGGVGGSTIGGGKGKTLMTIVGAGVGLAAGHYGQKAISQKGYDLTIQLDNSNSLITIVQGADVELSVGQRVRVISGGSGDRVLPL